MVKRMRRVLLYLLVVSCLLLDGCQGDPYYSSYTHAEPNKSDLVGTWVPDGNTMKDLRNNGRYDISKATTKLMLGADGSFEMVDMPDWWREPSGESHKGFVSSLGKWRLDYNDYNKWWEIVLNLPDFGTSINLRRETSPYLIHITIGDPDEGHAMTFIRKDEQ
jgi:hypothetical protein